MVDHNYQFLEPRANSRHRALFVKDRGLRAEVLYRQTVGEDPRTLEEVARDYDLPMAVVEEAVRYCIENEAFLNEERAREDALVLPGPRRW